MHHIAEYGIAAHWAYKEAGEAVKADGNADKKLAWLRQLVDWQQDLKDASEYLEEVKWTSLLMKSLSLVPGAM